ncbi:2-oxo-4-hydroxy-4-carboxy-5-ureidoimidazoline decarboxylase [Xylophilus sp. GOD-11R]|uniref:2-oxo-4-hydroxy-4-carboxy-5-ureidoimidazoline decarboxylase n=1 Tax=Xylophilus sp. GOD-11R TaxID=3089814 RepID=UPI00298D5A12|nr:2-oxo-4-hydroxy-4-carboxy-5-ureidoimidazoline decarboxylase [Xylophilus sp. GOD-11R]WPB56365.1 2-oxo-4-hydroxy-4-carboxy-5-ureidoimidazoline decarboxylase [Xylophilus sp. GOD-11R]
MSGTASLDALNRADAAGFAAALDGVFEHAPWVVDAVAGRRPFGSVGQLHEALLGVLRALPEPALVAFLCLHPELAGSAARAGTMTADSADEQAGLALGSLPADQAGRWDTLNARYRERFGFPFILCIRRHDLASALAAFEQRIERSRAEELQASLDEIAVISGMRLAQRLGQPATVSAGQGR